MPNGGVPIHMVLYPATNQNFVVCCEGSKMMVFEIKEWQTQKQNKTPIISFSVDEARALTWFLKYWIGDDKLKPGYQIKGINTEFSY
jgi:hypothetical protein